jgi:hypothetical protein
MNIKDIEIGKDYILNSSRSSCQGCSSTWFDKLNNEKVHVLKKFNNYQSKNNTYIQGTITKDNTIKFIRFWCSPYDLKEID